MVFAQVGEAGQVDVQAAAPPALHEGPLGLQLQRIPGGQVVGGQPAARGAGRGEPAQQPVLFGGLQVADQQLLGDPRRGLGRVETHPPQRRRPVVAQVDADRAPVGGQPGVQPAQHPGLEIEHPRPVDLVDRGPARPPQPVRPGVQARCQDHHLANARAARLGEEFVHEPGVGGQRIQQRRHRRVVADRRFIGRERVVGDRAGEVVDADGSQQRLGVRVVEQPLPGGDGPGGGAQGCGHPHLGCRCHRRPGRRLRRRSGAAGSARRPPASRATPAR
ncbi:hypothetical protein PICSAR65_02739 [Mycobacterium avium subsp. paratuberculosis]|nr:hypothetical protein PICSAR65_02739 [Mycobacterium avium subsp. paratuberculosis]